jgi:type II secretory pathway component PulK
MTLLHQAGAAVLLVLLTLALQCASVAALIVWIRSVPRREIHQIRVFQSAALAMQRTFKHLRCTVTSPEPSMRFRWGEHQLHVRVWTALWPQR